MMKPTAVFLSALCLAGCVDMPEPDYNYDYRAEGIDCPDNAVALILDPVNLTWKLSAPPGALVQVSIKQAAGSFQVSTYSYRFDSIGHDDSPRSIANLSMGAFPPKVASCKIYPLKVSTQGAPGIQGSGATTSN